MNVNTPVVDFVDRYLQKDLSRLHMPGHKGQGFLGCEARDITEIRGADVLDQACGIIAESEANAAALFQTCLLYTSGPYPSFRQENLPKKFIHCLLLVYLCMENCQRKKKKRTRSALIFT